MKLNVEYYLRVEEGKILVDSYFLKIQKKFIPNFVQGENLEKSRDFPVPMQGGFYTMPDSDIYLYKPIPYAAIKVAISILKIYFFLASISFLAAIFLTIRFLQNCNNGHFFIKSNITYIRMISYLAVGYSLIDYGMQWILYQKLNNTLFKMTSIYLDSATDFNWTFLIASLFLVLIAQAFTQGIKLKQENELTI
jgi:hypothetical protein